MSRFLKCACSHCDGRIEYPAEAAGESTTCPHCGEQTELTVAVSGAEGTLPRRRWLPWVLAGFVMLGIAGALAPLLLKRTLERKKGTDAPTGTARERERAGSSEIVLLDGFAVAPVLISKGGESSIVHALGSVSNTFSRQRYGVRVEIELADASGKANGKASDYIAVMEPHSAWSFRAMVLTANAATGRVIRIREQIMR